MIVLTFANEKGGVAKTTLATHAAGGLAAVGRKVLLIDSDPQAQATMAFGHEPDGAVYDVFAKGRGWRNYIKQVSPDMYARSDNHGTLALVASNEETLGVANRLKNAMTIHHRIKELEGYFDVVIFDTSPTPSPLQTAIWMATDYVIIPTQTEFYSIQQMLKTIEHITPIAEQKQIMGMGDVQIMGIIPVMYREGTIAHSQVLAGLRSRYGAKVWEPIASRVMWSEITLKQKGLIWQDDPHAAPAKEAWRFAMRLREELEHVAEA